MGLATNSNGGIALTKGRIFLAMSLVMTWWIAHLFPHYQPMIREQLSTRLQEARQSIPSIKVDWHPTDDPRARYNSSKIALIIEPRPIPHLVPQLLHMTSVVPPDWRFLFIGSEKSIISVGRSFGIKHQQVIGKLDLLILPDPWEIDTKENVHRLLTDMRFYNEFLPGIEWILKFESDSILCSNSPSSLNEWLDWSWAGAPRKPDDRFAGNGGLSLRRVSAIRRILGFQERYNNTEPEDEWFGKRLWVLPGEKVAAGTEGVLAVEDVYIEKPMGYHVRDGGQGIVDDVWKDPEQRKKIFNYCPELSLIMDMKLERERCPNDDRQGNLGPTAEEQANIDRVNEESRKNEEEARQKAEDEEKKKKKKEEEEKKKKEEEEAKNKQADQDKADKDGGDKGSEKTDEEKKKEEEERKKKEEEKRKKEEEEKKMKEEEDRKKEDEKKQKEDAQKKEEK